MAEFVNFHRSDSSPCKEYSICRTDLTADDKTACTCLSPLTGISDYSKLQLKFCVGIRTRILKSAHSGVH